MKDTYTLPVAITAAIQTGRPEMCNLFQPDDPEKSELVRLIKDMLTDREEKAKETEKLFFALEQAVSCLQQDRLRHNQLIDEILTTLKETE